ncbi:MAG: hypothetical protein V3T88_02375 [Nitrosomonadaceae bacterium]
MTIRIDRNKNTNDTATMSNAITLNGTTTITIATANPDRNYILIHNNSAATACWVKLQAASVDDDKKGIFIDKSVPTPAEWEMPVDNIYTGEISAISDSGAVDIYVTEY